MVQLLTLAVYNCTNTNSKIPFVMHILTAGLGAILNFSVAVIVLEQNSFGCYRYIYHPEDRTAYANTYAAFSLFATVGMVIDLILATLGFNGNKHGYQL